MKIGLILHTCDNYKFLWEGWYYYFSKYWNFDCDIYFVNEEIDAPFEINQIKTGKGEWSDRLIKALKLIPNKTIMYMQEDFWPFKTINMYKMVEFFEQKNMDCLRVHESLLNTNYYSVIETRYDNLYKFTATSNYLLSHQFGIWNKEFLLSCIKPGESPWVNEKKGTKRLQNKPSFIYGYNEKWYNAVCRKGKLTEQGEQLIKEIQYEI